MSTFIKANLPKYGEVEIALQEYDTGLYVCVYKKGRMIEQFGTQATEQEFLAEIQDVLV